ncbi:glycoside hydrolase superfamily [Phakopsora pachyrhizi]|uniref:endo-1,4-beta-xylanase n=1 Tax=Phakopsora pachyrhizi TaxID=170000 RepID=A0AAV0BBF3_PHAPC|nr:glycoside hydrolase superfamily [Phakopsora pachyrhizi]
MRAFSQTNLFITVYLFSISRIFGFPYARRDGSVSKYVGTAVTSNSLGVEKPYDDAIKKYFTVLTPENEMKWESLKPDINGQYKFENLHRQYPKWLESLDKNSLLEETKKHVEVIMERYASRMTSMDVCNEIIGDDGSLRQNIWMQKIGEDYIAQVFKIAREASQKYNPQLKLYGELRIFLKKLCGFILKDTE